jgi:SAM-dependent methyltransferase
MGLDINSVQFLVAAQKKGVSFSRVAMLGRQRLNVFPRTVMSVLERNGIPAEGFKNAGSRCAFAEPFFEALGAKTVDSVDNSDFEGARLVHDLNQPMPAEWANQFDVVIDGGTLEHVFNFPVALRNSMELVREGGRLFIHTIANNFCGHGFYQFSPELFYRTLSAENGYEVERMVIHRVGPYGSWREVADPDAIRSRVELITFTPVALLVQARRVSIKPIFSRMPQQSDYAALWESADKGAAAPVKQPRFARVSRLFQAFKTGIEFYRRQSLFNRRFFSKTPREGR